MSPCNESFVNFTSFGVLLQVGFKLTSQEALAGGLVEVNLVIKNIGNAEVYFAAGMSHDRPAYMSFNANLLGYDLSLKDPIENAALEPQGMFSTIKLKPGESYQRTVILNQFLTLEDILKVLEVGHSAWLLIQWKYVLAVGTTTECALSLAGETPVLEETLRINILRNDERLNTDIGQLAHSLKKDWNAVASHPVDRLQALISLTSLRIPAAVPYLKSLTDHPDPYIRQRVQYALEILSNNGSFNRGRGPVKK
jgi:hypothetical protein